MTLNDALALRLTTRFVQDKRLLEKAQAIIDDHAKSLLNSPTRSEIMQRAMTVMRRIADAGEWPGPMPPTIFSLPFTREDVVTARLFLAELEGQP